MRKPTRASYRIAAIWAAVVAAFAFLCVLGPSQGLAAPAHARADGAPAVAVVSRDVTISAPSTPTILSPANGADTKYYATAVKVAVSTDTTQVALLRGGSEIASATLSGETSVTFSSVGLRLGYNYLAAVAKNAAGDATSATVRIKVVGPVGRPRFYGVFYRRVFYRPRPAITGKTAGNTSAVVLYVNGHYIRRLAVGSWHAFTFRGVPLRYGMNRVSVVAANEFYRRGTGTIAVWRLDIRPYFRTLVLVDKSERHIYFIKNQKILGYYPCAIGKPSTPTPERVWRIDSKEYPDPSSAYGPRKMRLFARHRTRRGYTYEYTNYGIHGTDTPSSIGHMASHGCIRMFNHDVRRLFPLVPLHTMVVTRP